MGIFCSLTRRTQSKEVANNTSNHTFKYDETVVLDREKVDKHISIDLYVEKLESKCGSATYP